MSSRAPIQDLAFDAQRSPKGLSFQRRGSNGSAISRASEESAASTASAARRFFPSNLFGSGHSKKSPINAGTMPLITPTGKVPSQNRGDAVVVRSMKVWDVKMPPVKKHVVQGHLVPTVRSAARLFIQKRNRRLSIEIHGPPVYSLDTSQSIISSMTPMRSGKMQEFLKGGLPQPDQLPLQDKDVVFVRVLRLSHGHDDSHSPSMSNEDGEDLSTLGPYAPDDTDGHFVEHSSYRLEDVEILKQHGRTCEIKLGTGKTMTIRDIKFEAEKDALLFTKCLQDVKIMVLERAKRLAHEYRVLKRTHTIENETKTPPRTQQHQDRRDNRFTALSLQPGDGTVLTTLEEGDMEIRLLIDIVSAIDLPVADLTSTDPYVIVRLGSKEIHRTRVIHNSRNPIWTLETKCLCLLETSSEEFFTSTAGLTFLVKDYDRIGRNDVLGRVVVAHNELLQGKGERIAYDIVPDKLVKSKKFRPGKLVLRFKEASNDDVEFMRTLNARQGKVGVYADETFLGPTCHDSKFLRRMTKRVDHEDLYRVKPHPDPINPDDTKWMSKKRLRDEALKESREWVEAGSGSVGNLYVEVIGCDDLPNMDVNLNPRDKTDPFACLVFEDAVVNTDVIGDTMNPRWMPWCCRAFVFNISHPQSNLFLAIFDYDHPGGVSQAAARAFAPVHDPIGRVTINLARFLPGVLYNLTYPLYLREADVQKSNPRGCVTLRLRMEWSAPRKALIRASLPPPPTYVSCSKRSNFHLVRYTVQGVTDEKAFNLRKMCLYIEELQTYGMLLPFAVEIALGLWLWRGDYPVTMCGRTMLLPLHSATAFIWGVLISLNFNLIPAFLVFSIGWMLLAMNQYVMQNPSPWHKPRGFLELLGQLLLLRIQKVSIDADQDIEAYREYMKGLEEQRKRYEAQKKMEEIEDEQMRGEFENDINHAKREDVGIETKESNFASFLRNYLLQFEAVLLPVQNILETFIRALRMVVGVSRWDEPFLAWWITAACFCASLVLAWIPWGFLIQWSFRLFVFVFLGPWMAIYDRCFLHRKNESSQEVADRTKKRVLARYLQIKEAATHNRTRIEKAMKLKSMKKYMYGKYLINVPSLCIDGNFVPPAPSSTAKPFDTKKASAIKIVKRKYGQNLSGDMIPGREFQVAPLDSLPKKTSRKGFQMLWSHRPSENEPLIGENGSIRGTGKYMSTQLQDVEIF